MKSSRMKQVNGILSRICTIVIAVLTASTWASTPIRYMVYSCQKGQTLTVNHSLILELTKSLKSDRKQIGHLHCAIDIKVQPTMRVFLHFISLDISDDTATPDRLHIYDYTPSDERRQLTPTTGLYGVLKRPFYPINTAGFDIVDYKSSGQRLRVDYLGKPTFKHEGFKILITTFKETSGGASCGPGWFVCPFEQICVPLSTRCDGTPNCGHRDGADEQRCHPMEQVVANLEESVVNVAITGVGAVVAFLIVVVGVYILVRRANLKRFSKRRGSCLLNGTVATFNKDEDTARLYAPPSYDDVVDVSQENLGPPPEYSTVRFYDSPKHRHSRKTPELNRSSSQSVEVAELHEAPKSKKKRVKDRDRCDATSDSDVESDLGLSPDSGVSMTRDSESDLAKQTSYKLQPIKTATAPCYGSDEELGVETQPDTFDMCCLPKDLANFDGNDGSVESKSNTSGDFQDIHCTVPNGRDQSSGDVLISA